MKSLPPALRARLARAPFRVMNRPDERQRAISIPLRLPAFPDLPATLRARLTNFPPNPFQNPFESSSAAPLRARTGGPPRLLVLEDNSDSGELLKTLLDDQYDVTLRHTYDEALEAVQTGSFDLFVLDINLGEHRTGADLLRAIRQTQQGSHTPAIACTAYATSDDHGQSWYNDAGFNGYIRKPFEIDELFDTIERVLRRAQR